MEAEVRGISEKTVVISFSASEREIFDALWEIFSPLPNFSPADLAEDEEAGFFLETERGDVYFVLKKR